MGRPGGFLKTQNRQRKQRATGRYKSPYQKGGSIYTPLEEAVFRQSRQRRPNSDMLEWMVKRTKGKRREGFNVSMSKWAVDNIVKRMPSKKKQR